MFPRCTILYKTENTDGWYYAVMSGDKVACKKQCAKLIKENKWIDYKFYECYHCTIKRDIPFQNVVPDPHSIHLCTNLIFHPNNEKMYYPNEIMPYPKQKRKIVDNFNLIVESEEELEDYSVPDSKDKFECGQLLKICFEKKKNYIIAIVEDVYNDIPFFLERLKKDGYSNLSIEEYTFSKFLAWNCGENIRFIVQFYFNSELKVAYDKLIPKEMFYNEFERIYPILKSYIEKKNSLYDEFKLEQNLIKSLKWKYDKDSIDYPKEYVSILNSKKNKEKLYKLIDKIERNK